MSKTKQKRKIQKILDKTLAEVAHLGTLEARQINAVLDKVEEQLKFSLQMWLNKARPGLEDRFTTKHFRTALRQIREVRDQLNTVRPELEEVLQDGNTRAAVASARHVTTQFAAIYSTFHPNAPPLNLDVTKQLVLGKELQVNRYPTSVRRYTAAARRWLGKQLAIGVLKRESFRDMALRITGKPELNAGKMAKNMVKVPRKWVDRLVRTEMVSAYNAYHNAGIRELNRDPEIIELGETVMKLWDASLDKRACRWCASLDGEKQPANKPFSTGVMRPPQHPNCRCVVVPWFEDWEHPGLPTKREIKPLGKRAK